ncbi:hypothetical protein YPC_2165 [Yersinia pestis biovar Medievalis str. Harbin 35]|nr:hypothetical protein YPC_2165 [Yersinia pestis biovar Medievalis str. Harbin 35]EEO77064.1 hypothetical protein YP516_1798 [Yersinia pestis Nepal516]EEO80846.1 hypothetical protein YPF_2641 [Yersinia pestis biovar Orientalis str. India 195]EEO83953.1 hypothetical protein YPH_4600 [Yersinia pestis biovar Orientalis str. PEXU2]EEO90315.1 hypothetical protein YPS_2602 [Yersinia pestis Pestoides A]
MAALGIWMLHNGIYPPLPVCYYLSTLWAGNSIFY